MTYLINLFLHIRFAWFKSFCKVKDFTNQKLIFEDYFKTLDNWRVQDYFYNDNPIWLSPKNVTLIDEGVKITCVKDKSIHTDGDGKSRVTEWTSGMIDTHLTFTQPYGLWVIEAKFGGGWPALWLLKNDRTEPGYQRSQITPEVDIVELLSNKFRHTVHYGYSDTVYRRTAIGKTASRGDNKFHQFAVDLLKNGYDFYIDGILTCRLRSTDPQFVTVHPNYLIINNAVSLTDTYNTGMIVKSVKVYENG
jgi:beta-glucanase (GH16 family)